MKFGRNVGLLAVGMAGLSLWSCQNFPWVYREKQRTTVTEINELAIASTNTDVLFVIDNSGSMIEERENLKRNTQEFVEQLTLSDNKFRIGILVPDLQDPSDCYEGESAGCKSETQNDASPGANKGHLILERATNAELTTADCRQDSDGGIIERTPSGTKWLSSEDIGEAGVDEDRDAKVCRLVEDFKATVEALGTSGTGYEQGLNAMVAGLDLAAEDGGFNEGFLRDDADLAVIIMSDEDDCSYTSSQMENGKDLRGQPLCYPLSGESSVGPMVSPQTFVDAAGQLKGGPERIRAALIGGGTLGGETGNEFISQGCFIDGASPSGECACWSSACPSNGNFSEYCTFLESSNDVGCEAGECNLSHPDNASCDRSGFSGPVIDYCLATPSGRYAQFLSELALARADVGFSGGVFADSICNPEYDDTLKTIARDVILDSCFKLGEGDTLDEDTTIVMTRRVVSLAAPGEEREVLSEEELFGCDPDDLGGNGECTSCTTPDGDSVGWRIADDETICLTCGFKKDQSVLYNLKILLEDGEVTNPDE